MIESSQAFRPQKEMVYVRRARGFSFKSMVLEARTCPDASPELLLYRPGENRPMVRAVLASWKRNAARYELMSILGYTLHEHRP